MQRLAPQLIAAVAIVLACQWPVTVAEPLPTSEPSGSSALNYEDGGYTSTVPTEFGELTLLTSLKLNKNTLTGRLPSQLGRVTGLQELWLFTNDLSGSIPSQFGRLTELRSADWQKNALSERVPSELGNLENLKNNMDLYSNKLTGQLPTQIGYLSLNFGWWFQLSNNQLSGTIVTELGRVPLRRGFDLGFNKIGGSIPTQLGQLTRMTDTFYLISNELCATVPTQVAVLSTAVSTNWAVKSGNTIPDACPPTLSPTPYPTFLPTALPTPLPTATSRPTQLPTTPLPTPIPTTALPTPLPTTGQVKEPPHPSNVPTLSPSAVPTFLSPSRPPSMSPPPTARPTLEPTSPVPTVTCDPGSYLNGHVCTECPVGRFTNFSDSRVPATGWPTQCDVCPGGKIAADTGSSRCARCDEGEFSSSDRTSCGDCAAGTYVDQSLQSCESCPSGRYAPTAQTGSCLICEAGDSTDGVESKATTCTACPGGKYSKDLAVLCLSCDAGTYSLGRASECSDCKPGYFAPNSSEITCYKCSSEFTPAHDSSEGSATCDKCIEQYYRHGSDCKQKPGGVYDKEESTLEDMAVLEGYYRFTATSTTVYRCPYPTSCLGGRLRLNSTGGTDCVASAMGPLCTVCQEEYYLNRAAGGCVRCDEMDNYVGFFVALGCLISVGLLLATKVKSRHRRRFRAWRLTHRRSLVQLGDAATVAVVAMQTLVLLVVNHDESGGRSPPSVYRQFLGVFSFTAVDLTTMIPGMGCVYRGFAADLIGKTMAFLCMHVGLLARWRFQMRKGDPNAWKTLKTLVWLGKLLLPAVSILIAKTATCREYDNGDYKYLSVDQAISCRSSEYHALATYAALMGMAFPLGIPLLWLIKLRQLRHRFVQPGSSVSTVSGDAANAARGRSQTVIVSWQIAIEDDPVLSVSPFQGLIRGISPNWASRYEVLDMIRRLALTCGTMLFPQLNALVLFSLAVAMLALASHTHGHPYDNAAMNNVVAAAHWQFLLVIIVLLIRDADMFTDVSFFLIGMVLCLVNCVLLWICVSPVVPELKETAHSVFRGIFDADDTDADSGRTRQKHASSRDNNFDDLEMVMIKENPMHQQTKPGETDAGRDQDRQAQAADSSDSRDDVFGHMVAQKLIAGGHSEGDVLAWVGTWRETGQIAKRLKSACRELNIGKEPVQKWLQQLASDDDKASETIPTNDSPWVEVVTDDGRRYYHNTVTSETSWEAPPDKTLPRTNTEVDLEPGEAEQV